MNNVLIWLKKNNADNIQTNKVSKLKICLDYGHNNSGYKKQYITYNIGKITKSELESNETQVTETIPNKTTNFGADLSSSLKIHTDIDNNNLEVNE